MFKQTKKGQAVLEYIIILSALVAAFFLAKTAVGNATKASLEHAGTAMGNAVGKISILNAPGGAGGGSGEPALDNTEHSDITPTDTGFNPPVLPDNN